MEKNNESTNEVVEEKIDETKENETKADIKSTEEENKEPKTVEEQKTQNETETTSTESAAEETVADQEENSIKQTLEENLIICPFCSRQIPSVSNVCPYCGKSLVAKENKTNVFANKKTLAIAAIALLVLGLLFVPAITKNSTYRKAISSMKNGNYDQAKETFVSLEGYKSSNEYIVYCDALQQYEEGDLDKAISRFKTISDLDDADNYVNYLTTIKNIQSDSNVMSFESAQETFTKIGKFLDSEDMAKYCQSIVLFLNEDPSAVEKLQETIENNNIKTQYINTASAATRFIEAKAKFDNDDLSCFDEFDKLREEKSSFVSTMAGDYANYIQGLEHYNQEMFYSAYLSFQKCYDFKDASELIESCHQERPASGIIYNNTSSSVSVTIYDTSDDEDMFIKIYDSDDNLIESIYIRDGSSATARFQAGSTRMAIASGDSEDWFGPNEAFGGMGTYQRLLLDGNNEYFNFPSGGAFTLRFNVNNGNVDHKSSSYGDF